MSHSVFTVIAALAPGASAHLGPLLDEIGLDPAGNARLPFGSMRQLHFASISIHEDPERGPKLIFESNVDGPVDSYLQSLLRTVGDGVAEVFRNCPGWPADIRAQHRWLLDHVHQAGAFHVGNTGRSLARVDDEARLRDAIESFLDAAQRAGTLPADAGGVRRAIQAHITSDPTFGWTADVPPRETQTERLTHRVRLGGAIVGAVVAAVGLLPLTVLGAVVLRMKERTDRVADDWADPDRVAQLVAREDVAPHVHNHLTSVVAVRPGMFRTTLLRAVLFALNLLARVVFTKGELGGIPSIHFAHWAVIDDGRTLLFVSNYDGSWESYLGDFVQKAHGGLTAVWSNSDGFPRTEWLLKKGATDGSRFKHWARMTQLEDRVWYSAYPTLSVHGINDNSTIREGLFAPLSTEEVTTWLRLL
jgi:hypothetical protein